MRKHNLKFQIFMLILTALVEVLNNTLPIYNDKYIEIQDVDKSKGINILNQDAQFKSLVTTTLKPTNIRFLD